jgi:predicted Zn-dependent peptidase
LSVNCSSKCGQLTAVASFDITSFSCTATASNGYACIDLLPELLLRPSIAEKEIGTVRQGLLTRLQQRNSNPEQLSRAHLTNLLWGDEDPGGRVPSSLSLESISRSDVVAWAARWVRPDNATLVVVGNVSAKTFRPRVEKAFATWAPKKGPPHPTVREPDLNGLVVRLVDKPRATDVQVMVGHSGVALDDDDRLAALLAVELLGGDASGRLAHAASKEFGQDCRAQATFASDRQRGAFIASAQAPVEKAADVARVLMNEMARLSEDEPSAQETAQAAVRLAGRWAARLEATRERASTLLSFEMWEGDVAEVPEFGPRLFKVTSGEVKAAARTRLHADRAVLVLVGPAAQVEPQLQEAGWKYEKVNVDAPISARERKRLADEAAAPPSAAQQRAARALLDRAIAAQGGAAAFAGVKSLHWRASVVVDLPGGKVKGELEKHYRAPDQLRLDMVLKDLKLHSTTVINSGQAWGREQAGSKDRIYELPASEAAAARDQVWHDQDLVLSRAFEPGAAARILPDFFIDGVPHHAVQLRSGDAAHSCTVYLNKKSLLLAGITFGAGEQKTEERFSDYRKVGDLQIAYHRESRSAQLTLTAELKAAELNRDVDASQFLKPSAK